MIDYIEDIGIFHYYEIDEIDSTNTYFKDNYFRFSNNSVLLAHLQTDGRGRFDRKWLASNDICFSILFKNKINNAIIAPLAIIMALEEYGIKTSIKWPNDIYYEDKKLSGILIEDIYEEELKASIVGIGINLYDKKELNGIGVYSLKTINKSNLINSILLKYAEIMNYDSNLLMKAYKKNSIVIGQNITYKEKVYKAIDITIDGYLVVTSKNEKLILTSNEIGFNYLKKIK